MSRIYYRVWTYVEEIDEDDNGEVVGDTMSIGGEFRTFAEAEAVQREVSDEPKH